ncbi:MAG: GTP-binding protein [Thermoproteota archaeon]
MDREKEEGNVEYKLLVATGDEKRLQQLATQLNYRLNEGRGEAFYELGVSDDGEVIGLTEEEVKESLEALNKITSTIGASYMVTRVEKGKRGKVLEILMRRTVDFPPVQVSVALLGNVDSGKSTLKGVLVSGKLDDGNGAAMSMVARYLHEIKLRRSSSVSIHLLGFDSNGRSINDTLDIYDESKIFLNGSKIVSLIDLAGHEKYLKTTIRGVLGNLPDYVCIVVGGNAGPIGTFREHLGLTVALKIPIFMTVTKVDMAPGEILSRMIGDVEAILKLPGVNKIPFIIKSREDASLAARIMPHLRVCPIFLISNITGQGLVEMKIFLNALPPKTGWNEKASMETLCFIDEKFYVQGVGLIIGGLVEQGVVKKDEILLLGPFDDGSFRTVRVKSIHVNRVHVEKAGAGQIAALAITNVDYDEVRTGMVLLDAGTKTYAVRRFTAEVRILHHPTTIMLGYEPVIQTRTIKQAARIVKMKKEALRTGDTDIVEFEFIKRPEYIRVGDTFIFREGRTRGLGVVKRINV